MFGPQDHAVYREWLYLQGDGELSRSEEKELRRHLEECADCRADRRDVLRIDQILTAARVEPHPELLAEVMGRLPHAGWESRHPRAWKWAAVALMALMAAAYTAVNLGTATAGPLHGTVGAIADLFAATLVAGAGLLTASWQGLGLALGEVFAGSKFTLVAFVVFVVGIDLLFLRFLLSRPRQRLITAGKRRDRSS